jgi:DNA-directed RNA polymerase subunit alpha
MEFFVQQLGGYCLTTARPYPTGPVFSTAYSPLAGQKTAKSAAPRRILKKFFWIDLFALKKIGVVGILRRGRAGWDPRQHSTHSGRGYSMAATRIRLSAEGERTRDLSSKLELSTAEIGLTVRTTNCLEERGIFTVRELLECTPESLLSITNFGEKTLEEVYKALDKIGFRRVVRHAK